jgi:glycosyltransferase involved in cell wall biosynthesis
MNILFLNSLGRSKWGGGEKWMIAAAKGLSEKGHRVTIACQPGSVIEQKVLTAGIDIWSFSISADIAWWKIPILKRFFAKKQLDALICCQNKDVKIGAKAARAAGVKAIFARQGIQNLSNKRRYIKPFTQYIDGIITNTNSIKTQYESFGWFPQNFIHVIYNGVELTDRAERINLFEKYNLPTDCQIIFSAGRLDHQKGFDLLIEVAQKAKETNKKWQILIAGDGKLLQNLQEKAKEARVEKIFHLIGFTDTVASILKSVDVFVLPSRYEGMPNALLEAMAAGVANIATSVNGAPELVVEGETGYLVESENATQIYQRLDTILCDKKLRKSMGRKSQQRVRDQFTNEKMVENLEKLLLNQIRIASA